MCDYLLDLLKAFTQNYYYNRSRILNKESSERDDLRPQTHPKETTNAPQGDHKFSPRGQ